jgi:hypothetical protein
METASLVRGVAAGRARGLTCHRPLVDWFERQHGGAGRLPTCRCERAATDADPKLRERRAIRGGNATPGDIASGIGQPDIAGRSDGHRRKPDFRRDGGGGVKPYPGPGGCDSHASAHEHPATHCDEHSRAAPKPHHGRGI